MVSVVMITYKHQEFIQQAIKGVLMQECDFDVELIIANDNSPDNSDAVIKEIIQNHPNSSWIKYIKHKENIGMMPNFVYSLNASNGKYIALCEGDDYWTDPLKLQKQVGFLENNIDFAITFHKVQILKNNELVPDYITREVPEITTILDLAKGNYMHTCSVIYRNNLFGEFPEYFKTAQVGDYLLHLLNARYGKTKLIDQVMGVYRIHDNSVWSNRSIYQQMYGGIEFRKNIIPFFDKNVQLILKQQQPSVFRHRKLLLYSIYVKIKKTLRVN